MQASGEDCANAIAVTANSTYFGTTTGALSNFWFLDTTPTPANTINGCQGVSSSSTGSPDLVFSLDVPANQRLVATLNTAPDGGTSWDSILNIVAGTASCGTLGVDGGTQNITCVAGSDIGNPEVGSFPNLTGSSQTALMIVKGWSTGQGLFGLTTTLTPIPEGDFCESAIVLDGGTQQGVLLAGPFFNDYAGAGTSCATGSGTDVAFRFNGLAPNQRLTFNVQPDAGLDIAVSLTNSVANCGARTCLANSNAGSTGGVERPAFVNRTTSPIDIIAIVDAVSSTGAGYFDIGTTVDTTPAGDACDTATPLMAGTTLMGETLVGFTNDYAGGTNCSTTFAGLDRTYSLTIPAGQQATVTVTPATGLNTAISVVDAVVGCGNGTCIAGSDNGASGAADTLLVSNPGMTPRNVFIIVDSSSSSTPTTFNIGAVLAAIPPNDACENAGTPITASTSVMGTLTGRGNDYNWGSNQGCASGTTSLDTVHAVTIPAGQQLTATVATTAGTWNPTLNVVDGTTCVNTTAQFCLVGAAVSSSTTVGSNEVVRFINTQATARTVFVVVDTSTTTPGDYSLTIDLATPTQALSSIAASCDDLSAAVALLSSTTTPAISDDVVSPSAALPFAFSLLGTAVTNYSASSNGNVQLFASTGSGLTAFTNAAIPTSATPNLMAAPFWDDLRNVSTTVVRSATFGTAPNRHFTVEWFDSTLPSTGNIERLRFQAQFYETTNVTEFHYCSIVPGSITDGRANGNSATIGIEDSAGTAGVQASFNRPNSAVTGGAVRFTP